ASRRRRLTSLFARPSVAPSALRTSLTHPRTIGRKPVKSYGNRTFLGGACCRENPPPNWPSLASNICRPAATARRRNCGASPSPIEEDTMASTRPYSLTRPGFSYSFIGSATFAATGGWLTPRPVFAEARMLVDLIRSEAAKAPIKIHKLRRQCDRARGLRRQYCPQQERRLPELPGGKFRLAALHAPRKTP